MKTQRNVTRRFLAFALILALFISNFAGYAPMLVYADTYYNIAIDATIEHGTINTDKTTAAEGETVNVTVIPNESYDIDAVIVIENGINHYLIPDDGKYSFEMYASDVTVTAQFSLLPSVSFSKKTWNNTEKVVESNNETTTNYTILTSKMTTWGNGKLYIANQETTIDERVTINGTANLVVCNGVTLTIPKGITLEDGNTLNIYSQDGNSGSLVVNGIKEETDSSNAKYGAGIGGYTIISDNVIKNESSCGTLNIHGGNITITGAENSAGIGGSNSSLREVAKSNNGKLNIYDGNIIVYGRANASAIGGGNYENGMTTVIYGGKITATGGQSASAIGGGNHGNGGSTTVYGGTIDATGGIAGSAIGGGTNGNGPQMVVYNGNILAKGGTQASGIGGGNHGDGGNITINGGVVISYGTKENASNFSEGIGHGSNKTDSGTLTIGADLSVFGDTVVVPIKEIVPSNGNYRREPYMVVSKKYSLTLHTNEGTIDDGYDFSYYVYGVERTLPACSENNHNNNIQRVGYILTGWYDNEKLEGEPVFLIEKGESGNKEYWAKWEKHNYSISYFLLDGINNPANPTTYDGSTAIKINFPTNADNTKVFNGWTVYNYGYNKEPNEFAERAKYIVADRVLDYTIKKGTGGNLKFSASWKNLTEVTSTEVDTNVNSEIPGVTIANLNAVATQEVGETSEALFVREELKIQEADTDNVDEVSNEIKSEADTIFTGVDANDLDVKYFNMDITKYQTKTDGTSLEPETISNAKSVIEIAIPLSSISYDSIPTNFSILREHKTGETKDIKLFTKITEKPATQDKMVDGTFYVDNEFIYVYTQYFSTYAFVNTNTEICHVTLDVNGGNALSKNQYNVAYNTCLDLPVPTRNVNYSFSGWYTEDGTQITSTTPITKDVTLYAHWNPTAYSISYNLAGGTVEPANPTSYTAETETFTLNNPTKNGFIFLGWTGTDLSEPTMSVTIVKGSIGNREYTATWEEEPYEVHNTLYLKATVTDNVSNKSSVTKLSWKKVKGANSYEIYGTTADSKEFAKVTTLKKNKTSYKVSDLEWNKDYVYYVKAVKKDGTVAMESLKVYFTVGSSDSSNAKSITAPNYKVMMGETVKVQSTVIPSESGKAIFGEKYTKLLRYFSSDSSIASIDKNGNLTGLSNGKVTVFIYAPNGVMKKVTVNVTNPFIFLSSTVKENTQNKSSIVTLKWQKENRAVNYNIYGAMSGNELKKVATVKKNKTSYRVSDLEWGNKYEYIVKPVNSDGIEYMESIRIQFVAGSDKETNVKKIKASNQTIAVGATATITPTVTLQNSNLPVVGELHYFSSNPNIAVVDENGKVAGISKGKATIYIYASNGVKKTVKVTVK